MSEPTDDTEATEEGPATDDSPAADDSPATDEDPATDEPGPGGSDAAAEAKPEAPAEARAERADQRRIAEALILSSAEPLSPARLADIVPGATPATVRKLVEELNAEYREQGRAFEVASVAGGFQLRTLPEFADYLRRLQPTRPLRLSRAALETLAIVAYRQPVTRGEIEHIRGVDAGAVVKSLLERKLVRIAGHRDVPGRPLLYGTSRRFLEVFGLERLDDLPPLRSVEELAAAAPSPLAGAPDAAAEAGSEAAGEALDAADDVEELPEEGVPSELAEAFAGAEPPGKLH